jgi:hypothetical protein
VPPDCPVHQRSNGYLRATVDSDREQCNTVNATTVRAVGQRGTGLSGVAPDCPVPHEDRASNSRPAPSPNNRMTWRCTGHCPVAPRPVRCAQRQQPSPTASNIPSHIVDIFKLSQPPLFIGPSYTQDLDHHKPHKCHKRESKQKKASCESLALVPCEID